MSKLLERKTTTRTASTDDGDTMTQLLNRRAARPADDPDNPFPQVAALPPRPKADKPPASADGDGYTNRLLEAKRRAKDKDE